MLQYDLNKLVETISYNGYSFDVLRLDKLHPEISGNKWFKLKHHLEEAKELEATEVCTYGGVWSNHVAAFSVACKLYKLKNTIYIRSDEKLVTNTLAKAQANGSEVVFVGREEYKTIKVQSGLVNNCYYIPEGGATDLGLKGATEIADIENWSHYETIISATGTGTTFAGLLAASKNNQSIVGINAVKGNFVATHKIFEQKKNWEVFLNFHFGGFAKYDDTLIYFMNDFYEKTKIPTDIIYTSKVFYAIVDMFKNGYYTNDEKILVIHTGGLQGNQSLTNNQLFF